ncbi:MAG: T9SS type A sorting domain-containing protein [candidate division Zixibacteria bacterium]|nr:T9SS type A sorting domain-containing protein [candidate division Zixibacteria bacterium]
MRVRLFARLILALSMAFSTAPTEAVGAAAAPLELGSFLRNDFSYVMQHDSFYVCAVAGGVGALTLVSDSGAELMSFTMRDFYPFDNPPRALRQHNSVMVGRSFPGTYTFFDLSALPELKRLGSVTYANEIFDFAYHDGHLYFAEEFNGVTKYLVDNFNALIFVDSSMRPIRSVQLEVRSDTLFVLDDYNGVMRFADISGGLQSVIPYMYLPFQSTGFTLSGDRMLLGDGEDGFKFGPFTANGFVSPLSSRPAVSYVSKVLESDSNFIIISSPNIIEVQSKTDIGDVRILEISGGSRGAIMSQRDSQQFFITPSDADGVAAYHMNTTGYPRLAARYDHPGPILALEVIDEFLYTGGHTNPLEKYDPRMGFPPLLEGAREFPDNISTMAIRGDTMFIIDSSSNRMWVALASPGSLPRPISAFSGVPAKVDQVELFLDESRDRKFFIMRSGSIYYMSRTESGELFSHTTPRLDLGPGVRSVAFANNRLYSYTSKGELVVHLSNFFFVLTETARIEFPTDVNDIIPYSADTRLLLLSPGVVSILDISDRDDPIIAESVTVAGDYRKAIIQDNLVFAVGPHSTGILRLEGGSISEIFHTTNGGKLVTAGPGYFFTSDGQSIRMYDFLTTSVADDEDGPLVPDVFRLVSSFPNPFNGATTIQFSGKPRAEAQARIEVFNILGQRVRSLNIGPAEQASGRIRWDGLNDSGSPVASGIYLARLAGAVEGRSIKMIYVK